MSSPPAKTIDTAVEGDDDVNLISSNDEDNACVNLKGNDESNKSELKEIEVDDLLKSLRLSDEDSDNEDFKSPYMVPYESTPKAKIQEKVDMELLQKNIYELVMNDIKKGTTEPDSKETECQDVRGSVLFSKVYRELPKKLPPKDAENLSFALALSALLQVATDYTLLIEGTPDLSDIIVSQDKKLF